MGSACKLLLKKKELLISEIANNSGFNKIFNFNRKFQTIKKRSLFQFVRTN
jgi:AraC-like DNA-binding protein